MKREMRCDSSVCTCARSCTKPKAGCIRMRGISTAVPVKVSVFKNVQRPPTAMAAGFSQGEVLFGLGSVEALGTAAELVLVLLFIGPDLRGVVSELAAACSFCAAISISRRVVPSVPFPLV